MKVLLFFFSGVKVVIDVASNFSLVCNDLCEPLLYVDQRMALPTLFTVIDIWEKIGNQHNEWPSPLYHSRP